ncbi:tail fiber domain-containing protein [Enterobacter cancerogenus]|uniref:tail fiber domain-containing protein n=1 Tax=Enterobacter cancerogenus TaxID=69218 RepID=UPI00384DB95B
MLYNTGTIAINGNTATGTGTNWTAPASQVRAGQTIMVMSNPIQLFQITSINSATSLTVTPAASPALSGQKYGILITDSLSVDGLAQSISQLIKEYDENIGAWESFATTSANQNITVTINGTPVTIPGIGKLLQKGTNGALGVKDGGTGATNAADARVNFGLGSLSTQNSDNVVITGGNGSFSSLDVKSGATEPLILRTLPSGNAYIRFRDSTDNPIGYVGFASGTAQNFSIASNLGSNNITFNTTGAVSIKAGGANYAFQTNGNATAPGTWTSNSDIRIKDNVIPVPDPLDKMRELRGCTWTRKDGLGPGMGFIAQDVQAIFPDAVFESGSRELEDGSVVDNILSVDVSGVAAALHHEAILVLMDKVEELTNKLETLQSGS